MISLRCFFQELEMRQNRVLVREADSVDALKSQLVKGDVGLIAGSPPEGCHS